MNKIGDENYLADRELLDKLLLALRLQSQPSQPQK